MNPRTVLILGVTALVVLTLALMTGRDGRESVERVAGPLVPGLRAAVNDIEAIDIIDADGNLAVQLRRERERWRVREKQDYEADFRRVHDLLRDLAEAARAEQRTANPDWYARLGVADPGTPGSDGVMVSFPGEGLPSVILGQVDSAGFGRFARVQGESGSWLIDRSPEVPSEPLDWVERAIMNIPANELAEVTIRHPDGEVVRLRPAGDEDPQWVLVNVPDGREAAPSWEIRPVASALAALDLEDVRRHQSVPDHAVRALYRTRDGLNFVISLFADDQGHWAHFSVTAETGATAGDDADVEAVELAIDAATVDERLSPWQFAIPERRFERMTSGLEKLLAND